MEAGVLLMCYFQQYTKLAILEFRDTLIQHMESVKKSIDEKSQHKREYDSWVNKRQMQTTEEKVDTSKALDASLVDTESSGTDSKERDTSSRSGNDEHDDDADNRPIYYEEPMAEVHAIAEINIFAIGQHHAEQPKFNNEGEVDQNAEDCHDTWKPMLQSHRDQSFFRQPTAFKSERPRISKPRFASQVDVNNDLSKPVTTHYLPKERKAASAKPHRMIASSNSRISSKNMPRFSSNGMVHNYYLEEANKKTQKSSRNSEPSLMPSARSQSIANGSKPNLRSNTQTSRNWPASKNSFVTIKTVPIAEHSRNSKNFSDSKHFVCSTCQQCVFSANHDSCLTKFLREVNSRAKVPSNKIANRNKPVEQISVPNKQERQIPTRHRFSIKKPSVMQKKTMTRTFMPPKPDLVFHDAPTVNEIVPTAFNVNLSPTKSDKDLSQSNRPSAPLIKYRVSDSEDDSEGEPKHT
nr:hypothetical protein [Tanacetum cinerariifolium]